MARTLSFLLTLLLPLLATAQTESRFEVTSIKPVQRGNPQAGYSMGPEYVRLSGYSLYTLIRTAFGLTPLQIQGPDWLRSSQQLFDVNAKVPDGTSEAQTRSMLQTLIAERFRMVSHWETKSVSGYALVPSKDGHKLKRSSPSADRNTSFGQGMANQYLRGSMTMERLAQLMQSELGVDSPVENHTGVEGFDDIDIAFAGPETKESSIEASIFTVLQEKLGLKLEPRKIDFKFFVVDQAERTPTEN